MPHPAPEAPALPNVGEAGTRHNLWGGEGPEHERPQHGPPTPHPTLRQSPHVQEIPPFPCPPLLTLLNTATPPRAQHAQLLRYRASSAHT